MKFKMSVPPSVVHSVENWKIHSHRNFFSSNEVFSNLISENVVFTKNLSKKCKSKYLKFPQCAADWKLQNISLPILEQKKVRENNFFPMNHIISWFDEIFFKWVIVRVNFWIFNTVCEWFHGIFILWKTYLA